jgi:hypothetical protein
MTTGTFSDRTVSKMFSGAWKQVASDDASNRNCKPLREFLYGVADLVLNKSEESARDQHRAITHLADSLTLDTVGISYDGIGKRSSDVGGSTDDLLYIRETSEDLREKIQQMRSTMSSLDSLRTADLHRYRDLAFRNEAKLLAERNVSRRLRAQLDRMGSCRNSQLTSRSLSRYGHGLDHDDSASRQGLGALTVRSMNSARQTKTTKLKHP